MSASDRDDLVEYARRLVADWPPLDAEQRAELRAALAPVVEQPVGRRTKRQAEREERQRQERERLDRQIEQIADGAPPLTDQQVSRLRHLLAPEIAKAESGRRQSLMRRQWADQEVARKRVERENFHTETADGRQIVQCGRYAYAWDGDEPLKVGEEVWLPGNWLFKDPFRDTVTALGTSYMGVLSEVLRRA